MSKKKKKQNRSRKNAKKIAKAKSVAMSERATSQKRGREAVDVREKMERDTRVEAETPEMRRERAEEDEVSQKKEADGAKVIPEKEAAHDDAETFGGEENRNADNEVSKDGGGAHDDEVEASGEEVVVPEVVVVDDAIGERLTEGVAGSESAKAEIEKDAPSHNAMGKEKDAEIDEFRHDGVDREIPEARDGKKRHHYRAIMWWAAGICSLLVLVVGGLAVAKLFRGNDEIREEGSGEMIVEEVPEVQPAPEEPAEEPEEEAPAEPVKEEKPEPAPQPEELPEVAPRPEPVKDYPEVTGGHKVVALTFDDGPSTATTPRLLDILKGKSVKATFFVLGTMAQKAPEILRREAAEGHEVASHTPYHNQQTSLSVAQIRAEALEMDRIFTEVLGTVPPFTRPPYGAYNQTVQNAIGQPLIIWSVDPRDWQYRDASVVCTNVVSGTFDGAVILVHDIHASTVEAVPCIIDTLRAQGYEFLTVSELAAYRDVPLVNGGVYGKF